MRDKKKKTIKVRDLKPLKDAKGGGGGKGSTGGGGGSPTMVAPGG